MPVREYNAALGNNKLDLTRNTTLTAATGGATALGAGQNVRVIIDDTNAPSKYEVLRALEVITQRVIEDTWPQT